MENLVLYEGENMKNIINDEEFYKIIKQNL